MKQRRIIAVHICVWIFLLTLEVIPKLHFFNEKTFWFQVSITIARMLAFYCSYLWVFPRYLKPGKIPQLIGGIILSFLLYVGCRAMIEEVLYPEIFGWGNYNPGTSVVYYIWDNFYFGFPYVLFGAVIAAIIHSLKQQQLNEALTKEVAEAQLSFLRAQINPHFLFNTLNYLYALSIPVSKPLSDAIVRLSELTRYTLHETNEGLVSLEKEINYIENYIELFRLRFEPDFYVEFNYSENCNSKIAAMILIPFVENAMKHGVLNQSRSPVKINLNCNSNKIEFMVENKINNLQKDNSSGIGLNNVRKRLQLIYGINHILEINNSGDEFRIHLLITF